MADRFSVERKIRDELIPKIESSHFLGLDQVERIQLYIFAMALGVKKKIRTPLMSTEGLVLASAVHGYIWSILNSLFVDELRKTDELEKLSDRDMIIHISQEYANTGFKIIEEKLNQDNEQVLWSMIEELDETYNEIFGE